MKSRTLKIAAEKAAEKYKCNAFSQSTYYRDILGWPLTIFLITHKWEAANMVSHYTSGQYCIVYKPIGKWK